MKKTIAPLAGAILAALALSAPAYAGSQGSQIVLSPDAPYFHGTVTSNSKHCLEGRTVKLIRVKKSGDKKIGMTTTGADGLWTIPHGPTSGSTLYAKVLRQSVTNGVFCEGDRSNRVTIG